MSTNTSTRPLNAVPSVPATTTMRFAALLYLRLKAQQAFDKAMSLPRSAIRTRSSGRTEGASRSGRRSTAVSASCSSLRPWSKCSLHTADFLRTNQGS